MEKMRVKYNRVSTLKQSGNRFEADTDKYDRVFFDKVSGSVKFKDRPKAKELLSLIENQQVGVLVLESLDRCGRNTSDVIATLEYFEEKKINVCVRNIGLQSRPNGEANPIWKLITSILSSVSELELNALRERIRIGKEVYIQQGGYIGRPKNSTESEFKFLNKPKSQKCLDLLKRERTIREISKILSMSSSTVQKVKNIAVKRGLILP